MKLFCTGRLFLRDYDRLLAAYREGYEYYTSPEYWREKLNFQASTFQAGSGAEKAAKEAAE